MGQKISINKKIKPKKWLTSLSNNKNGMLTLKLKKNPIFNKLKLKYLANGQQKMSIAQNYQSKITSWLDSKTQNISHTLLVEVSTKLDLENLNVQLLKD